jgi:dsRNA-specific ribonuclease
LKTRFPRPETNLQYSFQNRSLLEAAVTHTSFVKGDGKSGRITSGWSFLGDAVLELCVSEPFTSIIRKCRKAR